LIIPWLPGYEQSAPVRIGNEASRQVQLDVFGEIADAIFQTIKAGMAPPDRARTLRPVVLESQRFPTNSNPVAMQRRGGDQDEDASDRGT
jgi:GH15 family glucan-1,4-alpha-glucosidase